MRGSGGSSTWLPIIGWRLLVLQPLRWLQKHHPSCSSRRGISGCVLGCGVIGDALSGQLWCRIDTVRVLRCVSKCSLEKRVTCSGVTGLGTTRRLSILETSPDQDWTGAVWVCGGSHTLRSLRWSTCSCAYHFAKLQKSKGLSMRHASRYSRSCLTTSWRPWSFRSVQELQIEISDFEAEANYRGTLVLVTDVPASAGKILRGPHRMLVCYSAE